MATAPLPPSDTWLNIVLEASAIATVAGVAGGALFTARYGRRASVALSATVQPTPTGFVIVARLSVKAVGVFRVRFRKGEEGSRIEVTEMYTDTDGEPQPAITYPRSNFFGDSFVDGGEELTTTTMVPVPSPSPSIIGWAVWLQVCAPYRFIRLRWLRRVVALAPVRFIIDHQPVSWLRRPLSRPWRRFVLSPGWSWTDQVFVPKPGGHEYADAAKEGP